MRNLKKALSLTLALVMCLGLTIPALAAEESYFVKKGLTVQQQPPTGAVPFTFVNYESDVPEEDAGFNLEQGEFYVESCTAAPAGKAGYQTITLKIRREMFLTEYLLMCGWSGGLYDYYTGQALPMGNLVGDSQVSNTVQVTYGGTTYTLECTKKSEWVQDDWYWVGEEGDYWAVSPMFCYSTVTVTAPVSYDGLVYSVDNRQSPVTGDVDLNAVEYADGENNVMYFRFGPEAVAQPEQPDNPTTPAIQVENIPASGTAVASTQTVTVDGKAVEFQMYALLDANGNGTNYVKLRDMAYILNGTQAQFDVGYSSETGITLTTGQAYQANGSEMNTPFSGDRSYTGGGQSVQINGSPVEMTAITLLDNSGGGYNYFKLRDLGKALGFNVDWSAEKGVFVETDKPYQG